MNKNQIKRTTDLTKYEIGLIEEALWDYNFPGADPDVRDRLREKITNAQQVKITF